MGKNSLGQTTVPVVANRRISYHEQLVVPGQKFECDEVQAKAWVARNVVSYVVERPKFTPAPPVDPVLAKVLEAEAPKPAAEPAAEPATASTHVEPMSTENEPALVPQQPEGLVAQQPAAPVRGRYDRRDMRPKS